MMTLWYSEAQRVLAGTVVYRTTDGIEVLVTEARSDGQPSAFPDARQVGVANPSGFVARFTSSPLINMDIRWER